ncbi:MAG: hypothetical protein ACI9TI_000785, partial [Natronomonas sp.]
MVLYLDHVSALKSKDRSVPFTETVRRLLLP